MKSQALFSLLNKTIYRRMSSAAAAQTGALWDKSHFPSNISYFPVSLKPAASLQINEIHIKYLFHS